MDPHDGAGISLGKHREAGWQDVIAILPQMTYAYLGLASSDVKPQREGVDGV